MVKKALIYGITGQDGHYLSEFLMKKGYEVAGVARHLDSKEVLDGVASYGADLAGPADVFLKPIDEFGPDEIYNLAGITSHSQNKDDPSLAFLVNSRAPMSMLKKIAGMGAAPRFFQASTAYVFEGNKTEINEGSAPSPISAYGKSKCEAHLAVIKCRNEGAYACNGILFNHESPLRTREFVTGKIALAAAEFHLGKRSEPLVLGNLDAKRDWGFAGDYVEAMWLMLQQKQPDDYVIATGESHSVREFCKEAFSCVGLDWKECVRSDSSLVRKDDPNLRANPDKAARILGWKPRVNFEELVKMMVDSALKKVG